MSRNEKQTDIDKLSFEDSISMLTDIVTKIEQGQIPLEASLEQYEKGMGLIKHCRNILQEAEKRIDKITKQQDGAASDQPEAQGDKGSTLL